MLKQCFILLLISMCLNLSTVGLPRGESRSPDFRQPVVGQAGRRRPHLVEGQRRGKAHLRAARQPAKSLLLPLHRSSSHWKKEEVFYNASL
jgi:hypothetical protein